MPRKPPNRTAKTVKASNKFAKGPFDWDKSSAEKQREKFENQRKAAEDSAAAPQRALDNVDRLVAGLLRNVGPTSNGVTITASCDLGALRATYGPLSKVYEQLADAYVEKRLTPLPLENRYRRLAYQNACFDERQSDAMAFDFEEMAPPGLDFGPFGRYVSVALAKSFGWLIDGNRDGVGAQQSPAQAAADPHTPPDELEALYAALEKNPKAWLPYDRKILALLAKNPNTPPYMLMALLPDFTSQVLDNPALLLIKLERPDLWAHLMKTQPALWRKLMYNDIFQARVLGPVIFQVGRDVLEKAGFPRRSVPAFRLIFFQNGFVASEGYHGKTTYVDWYQFAHAVFAPGEAPTYEEFRAACAAAQISLSADQKVGAKKIPAKDDPTASAAQLKSLAKKEPLQALMHPNCPPEVWKPLAAKHPFEAMESPVLPLLLLENPALWGELEREHAEKWVDLAIRQLSERDQLLFASDCAQHVLFVFENENPGDKRVRQAIQVERLYACGAATKTELRDAFDVVHAAFRTARSVRAKMAVTAANTQLASYAAKCAAEARGSSIYYGQDYDIYQTERVWQWRRLLRYLRGEADNQWGDIDDLHS